MSDFFRRASDALNHRERQDSTASTSSTDAPTSPNAAKPPSQEPMKKSESAPAGSQTKDSLFGTATNDLDQLKHRRHWSWGKQQEKGAETKQQPSQGLRDNDWIFGS
ncbi:uncharacterized protein N7529_001640 [Penicillium soppii]|uniref:uncharacterized protein n=1 Tax=Penicillium soppii TaxID=69789 RepID=UPI002547FC84|nr:uncharacterized protein N7529_001640 [Penicillium soppii]KAJ5876056.1 hypothetical protein N7529_001640 [Penicillium soppii]